jgi:hypothetical protein
VGCGEQGYEKREGICPGRVGETVGIHYGNRTGNFWTAYLPPDSNIIVEINNFQDSNKRKITKNKTMGYLPRVLFFNAFELGTERWKSSNIK